MDFTVISGNGFDMLFLNEVAEKIENFHHGKT